MRGTRITIGALLALSWCGAQATLGGWSAAQLAPSGTSASTTPVLTDCPATESLVNLEQQYALPASSRDLLKLLVLCRGSGQSLIEEGQLGSVYVPAMLAKDIALALEEHLNELQDSRKKQAGAAIRRLVIAAWRVDSDGDLGNKEKLIQSYNLFSAAIADLGSAYEIRQ